MFPIRLVFGRWARTAAVLAVTIAAAGLCGAAHAQSGVTGYFPLDTPQGDAQVPLPDKPWQKVIEHTTTEELDLGRAVEAYRNRNIFLAQNAAGRVSAIVSINANTTDMSGAEVAPPDFCYARQRSWKFHKQIDTYSENTFCWGVRETRVPVNAQAEAEAWQLFVEASEKTGHALAPDTPATQVRFLRSVGDRYLRIDYYFLAGASAKPWPWTEARDWARALEPRVLAGFKNQKLN